MSLRDDLDKILASTRNALQHVKAEESRFATLERENAELRSHINALEAAVKRLKEQRRKDQNRITEWQNYIDSLRDHSDVADGHVSYNQRDVSTPHSGGPPHTYHSWCEPAIGQEHRSQHDLENGMPDSQLPTSQSGEPYEQKNTAATEQYNGEKNNNMEYGDDDPDDTVHVGSSPPHKWHEHDRATDHGRGLLTASQPVLQMSVGLEPSSQTPHILEELLAYRWHPRDFIPNPREISEHSDSRRLDQALQIVGVSVSAAERWRHQNTPPGFWRSEFANTQENAMEKHQMELQRTEEARYRLAEALLGGSGRYIFRDRHLRELAEGLGI